MNDEHKSQEQLEKELQEARQKIQMGALYRHYKNKKLYKPVYLATQESDNEMAVVYQQQYGGRLLFTRPISQWLETVDLEGKKLARFEKVE
jgi:hypothetical protein